MASRASLYLAPWHAISAPAQGGGWTNYQVMQDTHLDDGQTRRYRFFVRVGHQGASGPAEQARAAAFEAFTSVPLRAMPTLKSWQKTGAFGLHGGPIDGPTDAPRSAQSEFASWQGGNHFGTWGMFGDPPYTGTTGTPRNAPVSPELAHAAQSMNFDLLLKLEQMAWVQATRPLHLYGLQVGATQNILLWDPIPYWPGARGLSAESLGRKPLWANDPYSAYRTRVNFQAHGRNGYDSEHWTTDLLFDYWSISGDAWAKEELRQMGESLKGLMRVERYNTKWIMAARSEGWAMVSFAQVYLATGDQSVKDYALMRINQVIEPQRGQWHESKCFMMQNSHALTGFPYEHRFYMPWQHGPVLYGFLATAKFFEDPTSLKIAEDVIPMVDYAWVTNFNHPWFGFVAEGVRYYVPTWYEGNWVQADHFDATVGIKLGSGPVGGAAGFLTGGFYLLAERTQDVDIQRRAITYGNKFLGPLNNGKRWYKWNTVIPEYLIGL